MASPRILQGQIEVKSPLLPTPTKDQHVVYNVVEMSTPAPTPSKTDGHASPKPEKILTLIGKLFIHVLPLVGTSIAIWLAYPKRFWLGEVFGMTVEKDSTANSTIIEALQYLVKLHELLIVASVCDMVLFWTQNLLINGKDGIPLWLMVKGYGAPSVSSLASKAFWRGFLRRSTFWYTLFVLLNIFIVLGANPSSAALLIPKLNWWSVSDPYYAIGNAPNIYLTGNASRQSPTVLSRSMVDESCFTEQTYIGCSGGDDYALGLWEKAYSITDTTSSMNINEPFGGVRGEMVAKLNAAGTATTTVTIPDNVLAMYGLFLKHVNAVGAPVSTVSDELQYSLNTGTDSSVDTVSAPLVQISCNGFDYNAARSQNTTVPPWITTANFDTWSATTPANVTIDESLWNFDHPTTVTNFTWFDPGSNISLGALITLPYRLLDPASGLTSTESMLLACAVDARWTDAETWFLPGMSDYVQSYFPVDQISPSISIEAGWADALNLPFPYASNGTGEDPLFIDSLFSLWVGNDTADGSVPGLSAGEYAPWVSANPNETAIETWATFGPTILGMVLADGLARINYISADATSATDIFILASSTESSETSLLQSILYQNTLAIPNVTVTSAQLSADYTAFTIDVWQYGYGYGIPTATWITGVVILLLHALFAVSFIVVQICLFARKDGRHRFSSWEAAYQLLMLAFHSKSNMAPSTSTGQMTDDQLMMIPVKIRVVNKDEDMEMVFGKEEVDTLREKR